MITIDQKIAEFISQSLEFNGWPFGNLLLCAIALVLSLLLCGAIGLEREKRGRTAGLRTHLFSWCWFLYHHDHIHLWIPSNLQ